MSSRHHTPGVPQSPRDVGRRNLRGVLGHHQQSAADIREAIYIKPLGNQRHLVRNIGDNDRQYAVGSNLPGLTFPKGQIVQLSSNTGHPGENIISVAPPGKRGSHPGFVGSGSVTMPAPDLIGDVCTYRITGKEYTAIGREDGAGFDDLVAARYEDGTYVETLATGTAPTNITGGDIHNACPITGSGHVADHSAAFVVSDEGRIIVWDISANTFHQHVESGDVFGPLWDGTHVWWIELTTSAGNAGDVRLNKANADMTGVTLVSTMSYSSIEYYLSMGMTDNHAILYPEIFGGFTGEVGHMPLDGTAGASGGITRSDYPSASASGAYTSAGSMQLHGGSSASVGLVNDSLDDESVFVPAGLVVESSSVPGISSLPGADEFVLFEIGGSADDISSGVFYSRLDATQDYTGCSATELAIEIDNPSGVFNSSALCFLPRD